MMRLHFALLLVALLTVSMVQAQSSALTVVVSSQTNVAVNGQSTGSVTLSGSGGTQPYQFSKNGGTFQSSAIFGTLAAGSYTFTIRDAAMATSTVTAIITQASALFLNVNSQTNVSVIGQSTGAVSLSAAGGTAPYQFSKDGINYQASATFSALPAGSYTFTVKDASLTTATVSVTITQSNVLTLYLSAQANVSVIGQSTGSVTLTAAGGTPPYAFNKSGTSAYQTSGVFNALPAGLHTFNVRDAAFNNSSITVTISQPSPLALSVGSKSNVSINGQNTGSVTLSGSGGTPPYQYSKDGSTFQSSPTFGSLTAGNYTFTIRDAAMATATANAALTEPPVLVLTLASQTHVEKFGQSTGVVNLTATGGTPPYQYSMDGTNFQSPATFESLSAGTYSFVLKDAASATSTITVTITQPVYDISGLKAMNNFTPNGDGVNDKWEIQDIANIPEHTLTIFDRGGRVLLNQKNYKNDWDGTVNGSALAEGTYYYALTFDAPGLGVKKGFITLIK